MPLPTAAATAALEHVSAGRAWAATTGGQDGVLTLSRLCPCLCLCLLPGPHTHWWRRLAQCHGRQRASREACCSLSKGVGLQHTNALRVRPLTRSLLGKSPLVWLFFLFQQLEACHSGSTPADDGVTVACKVVAGSVLEVHAVSGSSDTVVQQLSEECARKLRCMYATRAPESKGTTAEFEVSAAASLLMHKAVDAARSFAPLPRAALEALEASAGAVLAGVVQATHESWRSRCACCCAPKQASLPSAFPAHSLHTLVYVPPTAARCVSLFCFADPVLLVGYIQTFYSSLPSFDADFGCAGAFLQQQPRYRCV